MLCMCAAALLLAGTIGERAHAATTFTGDSVGPGNRRFEARIDIIINSETSTHCNISVRYYVQVTNGRTAAESPFTTTLRTTWTEDQTHSLKTVGEYAQVTENLGNVARGTTITKSGSCWYSSSGGTTYRSNVSASYTVPGTPPPTAPSWAALPGVTLNPYLTVSDMASAGYNITLWGGSNTYDTMMHEAPNRLMYARAIRVSKGTPVSVTGVYDNAADGAATTASAIGVHYNAMEFDANGKALYDAEWVQLDNVWIAGESGGSGTVLGDRGTVRYIVFLFRYPDDSGISAGSFVNSIGGRMFLSTYFTYSIDCNGGTSDGKNTMTYYRWDTRHEMRSTWKHTSYTVETFQDPVRPGHKFLGWKIDTAHHADPTKVFTSAELNTQVQSGRYYSYLFDDSKFIAQWRTDDFTLTLNSNGGSAIAPVTLTYGTSNYFSLTGHMTDSEFGRSGYTFLGWYTASVDGEQIYDASGKCVNDGTYWQDNKCVYKGDYTLYAHWKINAYTVTYDANGGSGLSKEWEEVTFQEAVDLNVTAEKEGYLLVGWNTDPEAKEGLESLVMPAEDITLYAVYSIFVSDVKELYLQAWVPGTPENYRIYPLDRTQENNMVYTYRLDRTDIASAFGNVPTACSLFAWDHAGNYRIIKTWYPKNNPQIEEPDVPEWFLQTVKHYRYDILSGDWVLFETSSELVMKGETYTPRYITPPQGYQEDHIDGAYVVEGDTDKGAYYAPVSYKLYFDPNGGACSTTEKTIRYGELYGELPSAERQGHTFLGWYTDPEHGRQVKSSEKYETADDSTVYAHWEIHRHRVSYDYRTNGGTRAEKESEMVSYGTQADLSVKAVKEGWEHVGWNTDPEAEEGLVSYTMEDQDTVLYAIYKKEIRVTYIDHDATGIVSRIDARTIYNKATETKIAVPTLNVWPGWRAEGWSLERQADAAIDVWPGTSYAISSDKIFYGRYSRDVTIRYDTAGSGDEIPSEIKTRQFHACGIYSDPEFTLAAAPMREGYSFVSWQTDAGSRYFAGQQVVLQEDTLFTALWDKYPEIEAYDRYFTLEQARNGEITPGLLLETVTGTDREDGVLENGKSVVVIHYQPEDFTGFTGTGSVTVTYQATDSYGNATTRTVTAHIVDTELQVDAVKRYTRFISDKYYREGDGYVPTAKGGLEESSIWKTNHVYGASLDYVLSNEKKQKENVRITLFGKTYDIAKPGTGMWDHEIETWRFTKSEIREVQAYISANGYGNYKGKDRILEFYDRFSGNRE